MRSKLQVRSVFALAFAALAASAAMSENDFVTRLHEAAQLEQQGEYVLAEKVLLELLKETEKTKPDTLRRGVVLNNLGSIYHYLDQPVKAESCYRRALEIHQKLAGPDDQRSIRSALNLGLLYVESGQTSKAERLDLRGMLARWSEQDRNQPDYARVVSIVGVLEKARRHYPESERYQLQALALWEKLDPQGLEMMRALNNLGAVYAESGRSREGLKYYQQALEIAESKLSSEHPGQVTLLANLGAATYYAFGPAAAEPYYRRALQIGEKSLGPQHSLVAKVMLHYAAVLEHTNHKAEAKQYRRQANTILETESGTDPLRHTVEISDLMQRPRSR